MVSGSNLLIVAHQVPGGTSFLGVEFFFGSMNQGSGKRAMAIPVKWRSRLRSSTPIRVALRGREERHGRGYYSTGR